jgi:hypothetical protein
MVVQEVESAQEVSNSFTSNGFGQREWNEGALNSVSVSAQAVNANRSKPVVNEVVSKEVTAVVPEAGQAEVKKAVKVSSAASSTGSLRQGISSKGYAPYAVVLMPVKVLGQVVEVIAETISELLQGISSKASRIFLHILFLRPKGAIADFIFEISTKGNLIPK